VRVFGKGARAFKTFTPLAIAGIGDLPIPLLLRSVAITMQRTTNSRRLRRLGDAEADVDDISRCAATWASKARLNLDPDLPAELNDRIADNWRPLVAVADSFGRQWGEAAREAAVIFAQRGSAEIIAVQLLSDIRRVDNDPHVDRMPSGELIVRLVDLEDTIWKDEYRGLHGTQKARRLSQGELASILRLFDIRPRSIWPQQQPRKGAKSRKGYLRSDFETVWAAYCPADAPAQSKKSKGLGSG